ncbi:MAG: type III-B CRISPR-associated protein Cas10/Cmr2, partial [Salinisphaera sp.]|nr:type III-B CRISPR-associated protein Cas10/Cmr2 [Salinisphaera sp.]
TAAIKRYLVHSQEPGFTATWESSAEAAARGRVDGKTRVPFPSMAAIAAGTFLEALVECAATDTQIKQAIDAYVQAFRRSGLEETVDPRALPALARAGRSAGMEGFLRIEPEYLFPDALEILIRQGGDPGRKKRLEDFQAASKELQHAAAAQGLRPRKQVAVLRMDGDALTRLILGDPKVIPTRWRDVLHPEAVPQVTKNFVEACWPGLLGKRRLMGPALHATITRSLADFAHRITAWVVEREFNGRLIYAGGDDLLALLPAVEAIPAAARLQQLFSAPYVLDTSADADPWAWRRGAPPDGTAQARQRFRVPTVDAEAQGAPDIRLSERRFEPHAGGDPTATELPQGNAFGLYPMLGRGQSLSAGIAIGSFKTPLGLVLRTAREMLEQDANQHMDKSALAVTLLSGGGAKLSFAAHWRGAVSEAEGGAAGGDPTTEGKDVHPDPPDLQRHLARVVEGFAARTGGGKRQRGPGLAGRLPYKLRDHIAATGRVLLELPSAERTELVRGLVCLEPGFSKKSDGNQPMLDSVVRLVECGLAYAARRPGAAQAPIDQLAQTAVAGLLLARKLAADGSG